jgi:heptose-I-phosphate ethanolaminephosphotransferase
MGSHVRYLNRYPKDFEKFSSRDEDIPYADYKKRIRSEYDNSVLYNDSIVGAIVSRFVTDETLLIYLSDHAEEVYDIRDYNGRSMENLSRQMVEIPFMIWMSDSFIDNFPYKKDLIKASSTRPYMTDDVIHTILDITDISTNDYEPRRSVISPDFNADRVRRIGDKDYDTL